MTEGDVAASDADAATGRYLYCVVRTQDGESASFETTGIDDADVSLLTASSVGAVVHRRGNVYASDDATEVTDWLLDHQAVVDEAGEAFGTPLPFRFYTVIDGDDEAVRAWLRREAETLRGALDSLAGHWEYRIEVTTDPADESALRASDDRLQELSEQCEAAGDGAAFLYQKQYDRRLAEVRQRRHAQRIDALHETLDDLAREVHEGDGEDHTLSERGDEGEGVSTTFTVLAAAERESDIGEALDAVVADPGVEVRFTGPWPPYTFAPSFGEDGTP